MAELKPCPFCGGESSIVTYQGFKRIFYIECKDCNALMGNPRIIISAMKGKLYFENEAELIEAWNTRQPMEAVVAELEKASYTESADDMNPYPPSKVVSLKKSISIVRGKE